MKRKLKDLKCICIGLVIGIIITSTTPVIADSIQQKIDVIINNVNIKINDETLANKNDNYTLANGQKIPYSILYKGTTYLPMRVVAESVGKDVSWDNATSTASINDKESDNVSDENINLIDVDPNNIDYKLSILGTTQDVDYENFKSKWDLVVGIPIKSDIKVVMGKVSVIYNEDLSREEFVNWFKNNSNFADYFRRMYNEINNLYSFNCDFLISITYRKNESAIGSLSLQKIQFINLDEWRY